MSYKRQKWEYFANTALFFYIWNILISIGGAWFASPIATRVRLALRAFRNLRLLKGLNAPTWSRLIDESQPDHPR